MPNKPKTGDLVAMRPHVQPPHLYGIGLVIAHGVTDIKSWGQEFEKIKVRWSKLPDKVPMWLNAEVAELISERR